MTAHPLPAADASLPRSRRLRPGHGVPKVPDVTGRHPTESGRGKIAGCADVRGYPAAPARELQKIGASREPLSQLRRSRIGGPANARRSGDRPQTRARRQGRTRARLCRHRRDVRFDRATSAKPSCASARDRRPTPWSRESTRRRHCGRCDNRGARAHRSDGTRRGPARRSAGEACSVSGGSSTRS